jgi:hypothetical protein
MDPPHRDHSEQTFYVSHWDYTWSGGLTTIGVAVLPVVFLWPVALIILRRRAVEPLARVVVWVAEPVLALLSFLFCFSTAVAGAFGRAVATWTTPEWRPSIGWYVAVLGIGAYMFTWVTDMVAAIRTRVGGRVL